MFRQTQLLTLTLPLLVLLAGSLVPAVSAGPACAKRNEGSDACLEKCGSRWGWPGRVMGTDPWGNVINAVTTTSTNAMGSAVTKACRVRPT